MEDFNMVPIHANNLVQTFLRKLLASAGTPSLSSCLMYLLPCAAVFSLLRLCEFWKKFKVKWIHIWAVQGLGLHLSSTLLQKTRCRGTPLVHFMLIVCKLMLHSFSNNFVCIKFQSEFCASMILKCPTNASLCYSLDDTLHQCKFVCRRSTQLSIFLVACMASLLGNELPSWK